MSFNQKLSTWGKLLSAKIGNFISRQFWAKIVTKNCSQKLRIYKPKIDNI